MPTIRSRMLPKDFKASFLSCERDTETILRKLFVESRPYSDMLKRLLIINKPDCLGDNPEYQKIIDNFNLKKLKEEQYISTVPRFKFGDHEYIKSSILLEFDDFIPTSNSQYRDCTINFTVLCHLDEWELDDYKLRPHQIAGYIDGILNESRLSGIGTLQFMGASQVVLDENWGGMILRYIATHGADDEEKFENIYTPQ